MITDTITTLVIGILFLIVGIIACFYTGGKKVKEYIPLLIGLLLICITTIGPLSNSKNKIDQLTKIKNNNVESIILQRTRYVGSENISLFYKDTTILKRQSIDTFCEALKKATVADAGFIKTPRSVCRIEIRMIDKSSIAFGVKKDGEATCLTIDSDGEYGWHYANLQANELGALLNQFTNR